MTGTERLRSLVDFVKMQKNAWQNGGAGEEAMPPAIICESDDTILCTIVPHSCDRRQAIKAAAFLHAAYPLQAAILVSDARMAKLPDDNGKPDLSQLPGGSMEEAVRLGKRGGIVDCILVLRVDADKRVQVMNMPYESFEGSEVYWQEPEIAEESEETGRAMGWMVEGMRKAFEMPSLTPLINNVAGLCGINANAERQRVRRCTFRAVARVIQEDGFEVVLPSGSPMGPGWRI